MTDAHTSPDPGPPEDRYSVAQMLGGIAAVLLMIALLMLSVAYAVDWGAARAVTDGFWTWFDGSIERLQVLGSLVPLVIAYVAYRVYASDRWWKRAQWALDASTDESPERMLLGKRGLEELARLRLAPKEDLLFFNALTTEEQDDILLDELAGRPVDGPGSRER